MRKLYVNAASKLELNERLKTDQIIGREYSKNGIRSYGLDTLTEKTVIVVYSKRVGGDPVASDYGEYDPKRNIVR